MIYEVAPALRTIPGVYRVDLNSAKVREYAVTVDPAALAAHRLDLTAVENAVRDGTTIAAAGQGVDGHELVLAVVRGPATGPAALARSGGRHARRRDRPARPPSRTSRPACARTSPAPPPTARARC